MTIEKIRILANVLYNILDEELLWHVATQSYPECWFCPDLELQWYIDANWLIRAGTKTYDPR